MREFRTQDLFLLFLSVALLFTAWAGYGRVVGIQVRLLPDTNEDLSHLLGRKPAFPNPTLPRYASGVFQREMETATGDSVPFLVQMIPFLTSWKSRTYEMWLEALPRSWSPVLPIGGNDYVRVRQKEWLLPAPEVYQPEIIQKQVRKAADYFARIAARWPKVRFYVFAIPRADAVFAATGAWSVVPSRLLLGLQPVKQVAVSLDKHVAYGWAGQGLPAGELLGFYFNTDHHLTMPGAYEAYRQVHRLISSRGVDMGQIVPCKSWYVVPGIIFRGSRSRLSGGYKESADILIDGLIPLPAYRVTVHGSKDKQRRNNRMNDEPGKVPRSLFFNHYREYFGADHGLIEYVVEHVPEGRKLLVIGDSFKNAMEPLLASHFHRTFFVDLRHFSKEMGYRFDLDAFLSRHGVTDVLFIGGERSIVRNPVMDQAVQERTDSL